MTNGLSVVTFINERAEWTPAARAELLASQYMDKPDLDFGKSTAMWMMTRVLGNIKRIKLSIPLMALCPQSPHMRLLPSGLHSLSWTPGALISLAQSFFPAEPSKIICLKSHHCYHLWWYVPGNLLNALHVLPLIPILQMVIMKPHFTYERTEV